MIKTCHICGIKFESSCHNAKYCSDPCRKIAHNERNKKWYYSNQEEVQKRSLKWYYAHKEECLKANKRWRQNNKEKVRTYHRERYHLTILPKGYKECRAAHNDCESCEYSDCIY